MWKSFQIRVLSDYYVRFETALNYLPSHATRIYLMWCNNKISIVHCGHLSESLCVWIFTYTIIHNTYSCRILFIDNYRLQRSWGKVIFSEACVKNSFYRGGWEGLAGGSPGPHWGGGSRGPGPGGGACIQACTKADPSSRQLLLWVVRILLECILVLHLILHPKIYLGDFTFTLMSPTEFIPVDTFFVTFYFDAS